MFRFYDFTSGNLLFKFDPMFNSVPTKEEKKYLSLYKETTGKIGDMHQDSSRF